MAQSRNFFEDVKKELECSVCQEQFSEINEPKILKCLHTFCKNCLEAWLRQQREGELSCPTCRQITECPNSNINRLPSNLFYKQMVEIVEAYNGQGQEDSPHCGNCEEKKTLKFYCSDCNCFLCDECAGTHKKWKGFRGHHVKEIGNFDSRDVQDYARRANVCKKHKDELRYFCDECKICICRDCAILEHQDHKKISFEQGLEKKKSDITNKMEQVEAVGRRLENRKESLEKRRIRVEYSIDQATNEVHRVAEQCISLIRQHEATMNKELLERKANFQAELSDQMTDLDGKLVEIYSGLEFGNDVVERNNLPEILNVEELLERRFQDLLSSPKFSPVVVNYCEVKYVPTDIASIQNWLGRLFITKTEPSFSIAQGKGLTEGRQGEDCTFTIITKDSQGQTSYSEIDQVSVDIQSLQTGRVTTPSITDSKDGSYQVKYKPEDAGEFNVSITVRGEAIVGSPFQLKVLNKRVTLSLQQGDITDERVDAIVNATNEWLQHGGGVAGAIVGKGGREIQEESNRISNQRGPLKVGEAVYTSGGILPCRYVIHTVGPRWREHGRQTSISLLRQACVESLRLAAQLQLSSIALTAIGSGISGIPKVICAQAMFDAVEEFISNRNAELSTLHDVRIVIIDDPTFRVFSDEYAKRYSPQMTDNMVT